MCLKTKEHFCFSYRVIQTTPLSYLRTFSPNFESTIIFYNSLLFGAKIKLFASPRTGYSKDKAKSTHEYVLLFVKDCMVVSCFYFSYLICLLVGMLLFPITFAMNSYLFLIFRHFILTSSRDTLRL